MSSNKRTGYMAASEEAGERSQRSNFVVVVNEVDILT